ncbi:MAG: hypothetical protein ABL888_16805 [Pirellulaceae bacterium]
MKREVFRSKQESSPEQMLNSLNRNGNKLFGLQYRTAISLVYGGGFLLGAIIFWLVGFGWCPVVTQGERGQPDFVFSMGARGLIVVLIGSTIISAAAFFGNFEETWHRLGILAVAGGFLVFGLWAHAIHKIEIHHDRFVVRGPVIPIARNWSLTDGNKIVTRVRQRSPQAFTWGRRQHRTSCSVHYIRFDGSEKLLQGSRWSTPLWSRAASKFENEFLSDAPR